MITLTNVTKRFGKLTAVNNLNLRVEAGKIFGLVGPDGAGKTTTIRMIVGIMELSAGHINLLGSDQIEQVKDQIGYVPQKFSLYGDLTVMENIRVIGALYGADERRVKELGTEILAFTNLLPFKDRLTDNLSGGMKQKLALAAGLMHRPKVFFLDEPTTGVDPVSRREFWQMLYRLNKEGMTIFVSTPYMDEAELCTQVAFMNQGQVVACDTPERLKAAYPYRLLELKAESKQIKKLLAKCPILDINAFGSYYHLVTAPDLEGELPIEAALKAAGISGYGLREIPPTLEDIFVHLAGGGEA
ncbi:ABC transporter ATP-binding protein [Sporomusa acidovorans]|uniref:Multidrug ABC transporter ATP-binding protein YbhF n=1 Tax=Sporomusa acidovorans (strain ATCC 49682 / DSM 3132 / Mol) TaxID=1123286 RepID=A0ABZ3J5R5_SPOA4|nr:ABC transporter ATP-binding protein [Sporomusa acidovorans]OZC16393.1 putative ABC transporter ATP-binding protein YbhF [Sporomusa acidovorans DSM 3132]SDF00144.1 ABC-2 type transport system ATP-binding protein [Sporomusa acidovorans]